MNKIVFVQREYEDKLGPMILSGLLKNAGYSSEVIINPYKSIEYIKAMEPEFIGLSVLSPSVDWALDACRFIKRNIPKTRTILGGPHPTFFPEIIGEKEVDIICRGEGEKPILQIMKSYNGSLSSIEKVPNLWIKKDKEIIKNPICDLLTERELSELPFCDRTHYKNYNKLQNNPHKTIWTSRGCPNNCSYCHNSSFKKLYKGHGKLVRQRSVDSVIKEIEQIKEYGWKCLEICDDQFIFSKNWILEFCKEYQKRVNMPFSCLSSAKQLTNDIVKALKDSGCDNISFAIESGVEEIRKQVYNKAVSDKDIYSAADALHNNDMPFQTFNMVGLPDESIDDIYQTIKMNQDIKTPYPWCSIVQPYPGTKIVEHFKKNGINPPSEFSYTFFQTGVADSQNKLSIILNSQRLFAFIVKHNISYKRFNQLINRPPMKMDTLYPIMFYWYYGKSVRNRHRMNYMAMLQYWLYSLKTKNYRALNQLK